MCALNVCGMLKMAVAILPHHFLTGEALWHIYLDVYLNVEDHQSAGPFSARTGVHLRWKFVVRFETQ